MLIFDLYSEKFDTIPDEKIAKQISLLKDAIKDWPSDINTVENFVQGVRCILVAQR